MSFPQKVREDALVACGRRCCICHKFCGLKMELHHIKPRSDGGEDTFENCIPLCFDCHAEMSSYDFKHPKGIKYSEEELKQHRDNWYSRVEASPAIITLPQYLELDRIVYRKFKEILRWNGSILFIRENNFGGFGFDLEKLDDLHKFCWECRNPNFEFIDADLEGMRASLLEKIVEFLSVTAAETFPTGVRHIISVPQEWEIEQPERFERVVAQIHGLASQIGELYDAFVKVGRRKLGVE